MSGSQAYLEGTVRDYKRLPWIREVMERYGSVVKLPVYQEYVKLMKDQTTIHPIPDPDRYKDLLLSQGHSQGLLALPPATFFRRLLGRVMREDYAVLYEMSLVRLMMHYPVPFDEATIVRWGGLLDRLLFGISEFATIQEVPTIGPWFWRKLPQVRMREILRPALSIYRKKLIAEEMGKEYMIVCHAELCALTTLAAASAVRHGRKAVTYDDVRDAALTLTDLFYVDVTKLEPPRRVPVPDADGGSRAVMARRA